MQTTPVREVGSLTGTGVRILRDVGSTYRDGGEEAALRIVTAATDRSASSDEMIRAAVGWPQRYHFYPARSNIVRGLDLPPDARVLEIGAGCGAVTRYLGESCALVDALEPVQARAEVARARCADLPGVDVSVGLLDDVPAVAAYDVVVVIGVLEYVGAGTPDLTPYRTFLDEVATRLVDGGTLVLAIENRLGVKYLVGSPEDHTNRVFDSIEGYPRGGKARTFTRRELESLMRASGLDPVTRVAFPDYKLPRVVFGDLPDRTRSLLHRIPEFPSPDWRAKRPGLADERSVWRTLVDGGLETDFGNSFLVLAGKGAPSALWPPGRAATFWSNDRRPHLMMQTAVDVDGDAVRFRRTSIGPPPPDGSATRTVASDLPYQDGTDLPAVLADRGLDAAGPLLERWLTLLDAAEPATLFDLVPHNLVVDDSGELHEIDVEFLVDGVTRDQTVRRGIFWLAHRATPLAWPGRWEPHTTVGDVMRALGAQVGLPPDGSWIDQAITEETQLITLLRPGPPAGKDLAAWTDEIGARLRRHVARPLDQQPLGTRLPERARRSAEQVKTARTQARKAVAEARTAVADARAVRKQLQARPAPPPARAATTAKRWVARALPRGTRRRALVDRLRR